MILLPGLWKSASCPSVIATASMFRVILFVVILAVVIIAFYVRQRQSVRQAEQRTSPNGVKQDQKQPEARQICPIDTFDLDATAPEPIRPFVSKAVYNLTMAIQTCDPEDLIAFDRNYISRLRTREAIIRNHAHDVVAASEHDGVADAVNELYEHLVCDYLPQRYPTIFALCTSDGVQSRRPTATHLKIIPDACRLIPLAPSLRPLETLKTLGTLLDDDFILLFPCLSPTNATETSYTAHAYVFCCPSGFSPRSTVYGKPLAAIHALVPGYAAKLEKSMDRFFARLEPGKLIKRANWGVVTDGELYKPRGNHNYADDDNADARDATGVDAQSCFLRVERQTLRRLPRSRAIVFSLKTYMTPLQDVKDEGNGEALADAIEGLTRGNVPEMSRYKRAGVWGPKVCSFLRE